MGEAAKRPSAFVTSFIPGLVLGLVVGSLSGAYFATWLSESPSELPNIPAAKGPVNPLPQEQRTAPTPPTDEAPKAADPNSADLKATEKPSGEPEQKPEGAPAAAPK